MTAPVLVTGATGNVGAATVALLREAGAPVRAASRRGRTPGDDPGLTGVPFDFTDAATWPAAFDGVERMLLVRPPALGNVRRDVMPALEAARAAGVRHVVLLSIQGAERIPVVPHAVLERWLEGSGLGWTFLRASFFHQNLTGALLPDLRERNAIVVPAGGGRTAFVDADDVAAVAALALQDPDAHRARAYTVTGPEALTYDEVAAVLTRELGRRIRYVRPGVFRYYGHARRRLGMDRGMAAVTAAIFTTARLGLAAGLTDDVRRLLGREPGDLVSFVRRERDAFAP